MKTKTSELAGQELETCVARALGQRAFTDIWPELEQVIDRYAVHVAPMVGKDMRWCATVVGRPGSGVPDGPWQEGTTPRQAIGRAIVAAKLGTEVQIG